MKALFNKYNNWVNRMLGCDTFTGDIGYYVRDMDNNGNVEIKFISKGE